MSNLIKLNGNTFQIEYGDYSLLMKCAVHNLTKAANYTANATHKFMMLEYCNLFEQGSIDAHKERSHYWIKDVGPTMESYIGFIGLYCDLVGLRHEWKGFVSCVNNYALE
eukprot:453969-Ditylum_brightwellii.AAC.1